MDMTDISRHWRAPAPRSVTFAVWRRNVRVWRRLMVPSLVLNFGEPFLYLLGLGFGLGQFIGEMEGVGYFAFLASGLVASSGMMVASTRGSIGLYPHGSPEDVRRHAGDAGRDRRHRGGGKCSVREPRAASPGAPSCSWRRCSERWPACRPCSASRCSFSSGSRSPGRPSR